MKKLRITVSGKVYDVEVQVLQDDEAIGSPATLPYPGAATAALGRSVVVRRIHVLRPAGQENW